MSEQKRKRRPRRAYDVELAQDRAIVVGILGATTALEQRYPEIGEFVVVRKMLRDAADLFTAMITDARVEEPPPAPRTEATQPPDCTHDWTAKDGHTFCRKCRCPLAAGDDPAPVAPTQPVFAPVDVTQGIDDGF